MGTYYFDKIETSWIIGFLLFFNYSFAQSSSKEYYGLWVKTKIEMKDGSRLFDRFLTDSAFLEYRITPNKVCINSHPISRKNENCLNYQLKGKVIQTSPSSGYFIEKSGNDSLILSERIDGLSDEKLKRFFFVRQKKLFNGQKEKAKDTKTLFANRYFTPKHKNSVSLGINKLFNGKKDYSNFRLKGSIKILPQEKKVETTIDYSTKPDSVRIGKIKNHLDNSFEDWNLTEFKEFNSIEIPFILESYVTKRIRGVTIEFFKDDIKEFDRYKGGDLEDMNTSSNYFTLGLEAYEKKDFYRAANYFLESYRYDEKNIDALYNAAAVFYELGYIDDACNAWKEISDFGLKAGKELYEENCR